MMSNIFGDGVIVVIAGDGLASVSTSAAGHGPGFFESSLARISSSERSSGKEVRDPIPKKPRR